MKRDTFRRAIVAVVVGVAIVAVIGMIADKNYTTITSVAAEAATLVFVWWWSTNQEDEDE